VAPAAAEPAGVLRRNHRVHPAGPSRWSSSSISSPRPPRTSGTASWSPRWTTLKQLNPRSRLIAVCFLTDLCFVSFVGRRQFCTGEHRWGFLAIGYCYGLIINYEATSATLNSLLT
jgi:hypothetical protein